MNYLTSKRLSGNGLKLFMREDTENAKMYYIFENDFNEDIINDENLHKIVGTILVEKNRKIIDFKINKYSTRYPCIDYQNRGYGTAVLNYIYDDILSKLADRNEWSIKINWSSELFESFKKRLKEKRLLIE